MNTQLLLSELRAIQRSFINGDVNEAQQQIDHLIEELELEQEDAK